MNYFKILFLFGFLFFMACHEDNNPIVKSETDFLLNLDLINNNEKVAIGETISLSSGQKIIITKANMFLSHFLIVDSDGNAEELDSIMHFEVGKTEAKLLGANNINEVCKLRFDVGVDSAWNFEDPALQNPDHPLGINNPDHWSWNSGYIFFKFEGKADLDNNGIFDPGEGIFVYHIGRQENYKSVEIEKLVPNVNGGTAIIQLNIDIDKVFETVDFETESSSHSSGDEFTITNKLTNNLNAAFR